MGIAEVLAIFGNPANDDGTLNEAWEGENIRKVAPPDGWQLFYQLDADLVRVSGNRIHRLAEDSFHAALDDIWAYAASQVGAPATSDDIRDWIHQRRLDQHGGGFNFRRITGGRRLSLHSFGVAIDWDPARNPRQKPLTSALPMWWYQIWADHGWANGRTFRTPDPMHIQFATGAWGGRPGESKEPIGPVQADDRANSARGRANQAARALADVACAGTMQLMAAATPPTRSSPILSEASRHMSRRRLEQHLYPEEETCHSGTVANLLPTRRGVEPDQALGRSQDYREGGLYG